MRANVYIKLLRKMNCDEILAASDSLNALKAIEAAFPKRVTYINTSRSVYEYGKGWIENRKDLKDDYVIRTSLADLRLLLGGNKFVIGKCSYFSRAAWMAASFSHGHWLPYHSVDECER